MTKSTHLSEGSKVAVVTGAGRGLGKAIALRFADAGIAVAVLDLDEASAKKTAEEVLAFGGKAIAVPVDISDDASVETAIETSAAALGGIDTLVNNAGIIHKPAAFQDIEPAMITKVLAVNVEGTLNMTRHALPYLRETGGSIVHIASNAGLRPRPFAAAYNASKGAIVNLTYSMAAELAPTVRVNAVAPSIAQTDMLDFLVGEDPDDAVRDRLIASVPMGRVATGQDIASAVFFLASEDASFITGVVLPVDGGRMVA